MLMMFHVLVIQDLPGLLLIQPVYLNVLQLTEKMEQEMNKDSATACQGLPSIHSKTNATDNVLPFQMLKLALVLHPHLAIVTVDFNGGQTLVISLVAVPSIREQQKLLTALTNASVKQTQSIVVLFILAN